MHPLDRGLVAPLGDQDPGVVRDRVVRVVVDLAAGHDRHPLVEQGHQGPHHPGLGLPPLAQEDDVVGGEDGVLELREDGLLVAHHPFDHRFARGDPGDGVLADLLLDRA